jgi:mRNA interferase HicA
MKRTELIRELRAAGCELLRHGARHDVYVNPATGQK